MNMKEPLTLLLWIGRLVLAQLVSQLPAGTKATRVPAVLSLVNLVSVIAMRHNQ
jgi:hypothetical protein